MCTRVHVYYCNSGRTPWVAVSGPALTGWTSLYQLFFLKRKVGQKKSIRISQPKVVRCFYCNSGLTPWVAVYTSQAFTAWDVYAFQALRPEMQKKKNKIIQPKVGLDYSTTEVWGCGPGFQQAGIQAAGRTFSFAMQHKSWCTTMISIS